MAVKLFPGSYITGSEGSKLNTRLYAIPLISDNAWDMTRNSTFCCFDSPLTCKQKLTISSEVAFLIIFVITVGKETKKQRRLTVRCLAYRIYKQCAYMGLLKSVEYLMENLGVVLLISVHSECHSAVVFKIHWQQILKLNRKYLSVNFFESFHMKFLSFCVHIFPHVWVVSSYGFLNPSLCNFFPSTLSGVATACIVFCLIMLHSCLQLS